MRLVCPNCDAKYEVPDEAIPESGRDVQCANCSHAWFQMRPAKTSVADISPVAASAGTVAAPVDQFAAVEAEPEAKIAPQAATPEPAGYGVDESVLSILREEAEREANARMTDARGMGAPSDAGLAAASTAIQKRDEMPHHADPEVEAKPSARRDLLPDVEEINSTLRPSEQGGGAFGDDAAADAARSRNSFRSGFMMMLVLAVLGLIAYMVAPQLSAQVPALKGPLTAYVGFVDMMRLQLDGLMQSATMAINGEG
jgi:predicted Zn finger-like uncharacterized protein